MSIRIETLTSKTASDYKYSKNQTIGTKESGVDIEKDVVDKEGCYIDDTYPSDTTTYSGNKIERVASAAADSKIDDETASDSTTYSSAKIEELIASIPSGGRGITNSTAAPHTFIGIQTIVTTTKEE